MSSKYLDLRYKLIHHSNSLPGEYHTVFEVGCTDTRIHEDDTDFEFIYGVYQRGTTNLICQTGQSEALAYIIVELLNNMDLVDSALNLIGKIDEKYDFTVETEDESLPLYQKPK